MIFTLKAARVEIDAPKGMYTQKTYGVEYGFTPEMFNEKADELIVSFEEHMLAKSANDNW